MKEEELEEDGLVNVHIDDIMKYTMLETVSETSTEPVHEPSVFIQSESSSATHSEFIVILEAPHPIVPTTCAQTSVIPPAAPAQTYLTPPVFVHVKTEDDPFLIPEMPHAPQVMLPPSHRWLARGEADPSQVRVLRASRLTKWERTRNHIAFLEDDLSDMFILKRFCVINHKS